VIAGLRSYKKTDGQRGCYLRGTKATASIWMSNLVEHNTNASYSTTDTNRPPPLPSGRRSFDIKLLASCHALRCLRKRRGSARGHTSVHTDGRVDEIKNMAQFCARIESRMHVTIDCITRTFETSGQGILRKTPQQRVFLVPWNCSLLGSVLLITMCLCLRSHAYC
jgi:hypothetical protein